MSRPLLAVLAAAAIGLAACGATDVADAGPTTPAPSPTHEDPSPTHDEVAATSEAAPVLLRFDGRQVPVASACAGVDGAVLATTEGEVTITLVREEGLAMRWQAEGAESETDGVEESAGADATTWTATLGDVDTSVRVVMVVADDAAAVLDDC